MFQAIAGTVAAGGGGEDGEKGTRMGSQHLNVGAAPDLDVPGLCKSEKHYERVTERKDLQVV